MPEALPGAAPFPQALRARLERALAQRGAGYEPRTRHRHADGSPRYSNRLLLETSPYLQQHAHNPVNWYPWGDEAFETARRLNRPVMVSIGYSTCHWCHVMEQESFDDPKTALLLNAHFVAIKVDREVRPDVDAIYMSAAHALQGSSGWPLNVWITPDREPFFAGTYFPPEDRAGRPGFPSLLARIQERWSADRDRIEQTAGRLTTLIRRDLEGAPVDALRSPDPQPMHRAFDAYVADFDSEWGGVGWQVKFPASLPVRFLLRYQRRSGDPRALEMVTRTLRKMAAGGIHDQVGGGFHRYATDRRWLVPHFEKMLYDNALRVIEYVEAWQATGREEFAEVARRTLEHAAREMKAAEGGFYSATDADSRAPGGEMEEGRFFTWTPAEVDAVLDAPDAAAAKAFWGVRAGGNLDGRTVLHAWRPPAEVAAELGVDGAELGARLERARQGLYRARQRRAAPLRDEKILTAWNALMISAFARAGFAFDEARWLRDAVAAMEFVLAQLRHEGRLQRVHQDGRSAGAAFLEDYAFLVAALLDLYEAQPRTRWLREALTLQEVLDAHYWDERGSGYFQTADDQERLIAREKPMSDGALPSGNSVAASNLLRLAGFTGAARFAERADLLFAAMDADLRRNPTGLSTALLALDLRLDAIHEIVVVRPSGSAGGLSALLAPLRRSFVPNRILAVVTEGADLEAHAALVPVVAGKRAQADRATAYVCRERVCRRPTSDPRAFSQQIGIRAPLR